MMLWVDCNCCNVYNDEQEKKEEEWDQVQISCCIQ